MKTLKNKLTSLFMVFCGVLPIIYDKDGTALLVFSCIAIPMFFSREDWFSEPIER